MYPSAIVLFRISIDVRALPFHWAAPRRALALLLLKIRSHVCNRTSLNEKKRREEKEKD